MNAQADYEASKGEVIVSGLYLKHMYEDSIDDLFQALEIGLETGEIETKDLHTFITRFGMRCLYTKRCRNFNPVPDDVISWFVEHSIDLFTKNELVSYLMGLCVCPREKTLEKIIEMFTPEEINIGYMCKYFDEEVLRRYLLEVDITSFLNEDPLNEIMIKVLATRLGDLDEITNIAVLYETLDKIPDIPPNQDVRSALIERLDQVVSEDEAQSRTCVCNMIVSLSKSDNKTTERIFSDIEHILKRHHSFNSPIVFGDDDMTLMVVFVWILMRYPHPIKWPFNVSDSLAKYINLDLDSYFSIYGSRTNVVRVQGLSNDRIGLIRKTLFVGKHTEADAPLFREIVQIHEADERLWN